MLKYNNPISHNHHPSTRTKEPVPPPPCCASRGCSGCSHSSSCRRSARCTTPFSRARNRPRRLLCTLSIMDLAHRSTGATVPPRAATGRPSTSASSRNTCTPSAQPHVRRRFVTCATCVTTDRTEDHAFRIIGLRSRTRRARVPPCCSWTTGPCWRRSGRPSKSSWSRAASRRSRRSVA